MSTFECTYNQLRQLAGEYLKSIRETSPTLEELDAGFKCLGLHYLGMHAAHGHERAGAAALMRIVTREYLKAELACEVTQ